MLLYFEVDHGLEEGVGGCVWGEAACYNHIVSVFYFYDRTIVHIKTS